MNKNTLAQIGRILLSFLFVFGAVSKLVSMPFFDGMVAELLLGKDYFDNPVGMIWVQWLTRILVAVELVLGLALLQNKWFKKIVLPATLGMLVLFTIHLFYEGFRQVNGFTEGNCGCFGDVLPMTNLESIIKNVIGMLIGFFVLLTFKKEDVFKSWISPTLLGVITLFTLSFGIKSYEAVAPSVVDELGTMSGIELHEADSMAKLAETEAQAVQSPENEIAPQVGVDDKLKNDVPKATSSTAKSPSDVTLELLSKYAPELKSQSITTGTKMVCLFSMTCSHCQEVYRDLSAMKSSGKLPKLILVNYGTEYEQNYFFSQAGDSKDAHSRTEDFTHFKRMLEGKTYPRILVIKNGKIEKEWDVDTYEKSYVMRYFGIEKLEEKKSGGLQLELQSGGSPW
jgi:hypothetical protein